MRGRAEHDAWQSGKNRSTVGPPKADCRRPDLEPQRQVAPNPFIATAFPWATAPHLKADLQLKGKVMPANDRCCALLHLKQGGGNMGKGYKGGPCIYCLEREAEDGDHVISRQFFPKDKRDSLPKVPA